MIVAQDLLLSLSRRCICSDRRTTQVGRGWSNEQREKGKRERGQGASERLSVCLQNDFTVTSS